VYNVIVHSHVVDQDEEHWMIAGAKLI